MNKIIVDKLDDAIYHEILDNGLEIYIYKKPGFANKSVSLTTKYGSCDDEFKYEGESKYHKYPKGIAHFLEHKLFESQDNEHVFKKFENYGASVNAYTSSYETSYYFSTNDNFYECLDLLMDFVWTPYITDENVEKEKGIIKQEISMIGDSLYRFIYNKSLENALVLNHNRYNVAGTHKSVDKITKKELDECYEAFYHPSNMFLTISGDIDIKKTIDLIKKNKALSKFKENKKIIKKEYKEPLKVFKEYEVIKRNVAVDRMVINYKFILSRLNTQNGLLRGYLLSQLLDNNFGPTKPFENDLIKDKVIKSVLTLNYFTFDDVALLSIAADVLDKDEFLKRVENKLFNPEFDEKLFVLNKKSYLSSIIKVYDNPESVTNVIERDIIKYGGFINDAYKMISDYSFDDYKKDYKKLDFNSRSILYIEKKGK